MKIPDKAVSYSQILSALKSYLEGKPDYERWKDYFESSVGTTYMELLAGLGSFLSYHGVSSITEGKLMTAVSRDAVYNEANGIGYSPNRNSAPVLRLTGVATANVTLSRLIPIGIIGSYNLSPVRDYVLNMGEAVSIDVYVGDWAEYQKEFFSGSSFKRIHIEDESIASNIDAFGLTINRSGSVIPLRVTERPEDFHPEGEVRRQLILDNGALVDPIIGTLSKLPTDPYLFIRRGTVIFTVTDETTQSVVDKLADQIGQYEGSGPIGFLYGKTMSGWINYATGEYQIEGFSWKQADGVTPRLPDWNVDLFSIKATYEATYSLTSTTANEMALLRSMADGFILQFGDGVFGFNPLPGDVMTFRYVKTEGPVIIDGQRQTTINVSQVTLNIDFTLNSVATIDVGALADSVDKVRALAPGYYSARRHAVSALDHEALLLSLSGELIGAKARRKDFAITKVYPTQADMLADTNAVDITSYGVGAMVMVSPLTPVRDRVYLGEEKHTIDLVADKVIIDANALVQGSVKFFVDPQFSGTKSLPVPLLEDVDYWINPMPFIGCCVGQISYLFDDRHIAMEEEKVALSQQLEAMTVMGERIELTDSIAVYLKPTVTVVVETGTDYNTVMADVLAAINRGTKILGEVYRPGQVIDEISQLSYVTRLYMVAPVSDHILAATEYVVPVTEDDITMTVIDNPVTPISITPNDLCWSYTP